LEQKLRVYFSCRSKPTPEGQFVSRAAFVDLDREHPTTVLDVCDRPVLELGGPGDFDQFGTMPGSVVRDGDRFLMYYCGWARRLGVPYNWAIGVAISTDGGLTFKRHGRGPVVGPTNAEPYLQACPVVRKRADGDWIMWYLSGLEWIEHKGRMESVYVLTAARSTDGFHWRRDGKPIIPTKVDKECQTSPAVFDRQMTGRAGPGTTPSRGSCRPRQDGTQRWSAIPVSWTLAISSLCSTAETTSAETVSGWQSKTVLTPVSEAA
jgi:hypothetical protein